MTFLDIEASGLEPESYPIEIGWVSPVEGFPGESFLIRPEPDWTFWNEESGRIHNIPRQLCVEEGISVVEAAHRLNRSMAGRRVYSDVESYDSFWLDRLYRAAGVRREFLLDNTLGAWLEGIEEMTKFGLNGFEEMEGIQNCADARYPHVHRAEPDARQQAAVMRAFVDADFRRSIGHVDNSHAA